MSEEVIDYLLDYLGSVPSDETLIAAMDAFKTFDQSQMTDEEKKLANDEEYRKQYLESHKGLPILESTELLGAYELLIYDRINSNEVQIEYAEVSGIPERYIEGAMKSLFPVIKSTVQLELENIIHNASFIPTVKTDYEKDLVNSNFKVNIGDALYFMREPDIGDDGYLHREIVEKLIENAANNKRITSEQLRDLLDLNQDGFISGKEKDKVRAVIHGFDNVLQYYSEKNGSPDWLKGDDITANILEAVDRVKPVTPPRYLPEQQASTELEKKSRSV